MSNSCIIALSQPALTISDISARVIRNGVRDVGSVSGDGALMLDWLGGVGDASLGFADDGSLRYRLTGPIDNGQPVTLTWDDGNGQKGSYAYGVAGTPPSVIVPMRDSSVMVDNTWLYRNGVDISSSVSFAISHINTTSTESTTPDLSISGWPTYYDGAAYLLLYSISGVIYSSPWTALLISPSSATSPGFIAHFIQILARQRPFMTGIDGQGRQTMSVNFDVWGVGLGSVGGDVSDGGNVNRMEAGILKILSSTSPPISAFGTDTFIGQTIDIPPTSPGPFLILIDTGGMSPLECQGGEKIQRMSLQVFGRAKDVSVIRAKMMRVYEVLDGLREMDVEI
jgi:hypothetical protein